MSDDSLEAPIGPVLGGSRRQRDRTRIALVAGITIVVLGAGIGLAGNGFTEAPSASPGAASQTLPVAVVPTPSVSPTATGAGRTQSAGPGCATVRLGNAPELRLSSDVGNVDPAPGLPLSPTPSAGPSAEPSWPIPPIEDAARTGDTDGLLLVPDDDACVRHVDADYRPADPTLAGPFPMAWRTLDVSPVRSVVPLGPLPRGDWVVRIVAGFSTGTPGQDVGSVTERFFRVLAGRGGGPLDTPELPPAVPCVALAAAATPPDLTLYGVAQGPTPGIPPGAGPPPVIDATPGEALEIRASGDACARSWSIQADDVDTGSHLEIETRENPTSDPFLSAQNRWRIATVPTGLLEITATMGFSADVTVSRRWAVIVRADDPPEADVTLPDGPAIAAAYECTPRWSYPAGTGITAMCTDAAIIGDVPTISVAAGLPIRLEVPDWKVLAWNATCGRLDALDRPSDPFIQVDSCNLGGSLAPGPIVVLPRSSGPVVRFQVTLERDGVRVEATYYATLEPSS